ncbi:NAD-dependent epimerase/dehydratase family protein [Candidatus Uhrbacteria bacterium]|nr:NAD-dependent epimerase/dehydratase family protein [Candidatus Uhrbacteria bacterium]
MPLPTSSKKTILVTGGAGFMGSHLCERLIADGHRVVCVDDFSTSERRNIDGLLPNPNFRFIRADINGPFELEAYPELSAFKIPFQGIQQVYHLACPTSIVKFNEHRMHTLQTNSIGNIHVLEIARKYRSQVVFTSSSVVYGGRKGEMHLVKEDELGMFDHLSPRGCYDEGKRFSETVFETYRQVYGMDVKIARVFRTYGPRMPLFDGHVIPDFILNALDNKPLEINGDPSFRTSLVYVSDVVDALVRLMKAPSEFGPVNIGSDFDLKLSDVAQKIIDIVGASSQITYKPPLSFLSVLPLPDTRKSRELGWIPLTRLEDGLQKTIEYIKANRLLLTNF